jgi:hypothetical protein
MKNMMAANSLKDGSANTGTWVRIALARDLALSADAVQETYGYHATFGFIRFPAIL